MAVVSFLQPQVAVENIADNITVLQEILDYLPNIPAIINEQTVISGDLIEQDIDVLKQKFIERIGTLGEQITSVLEKEGAATRTLVEAVGKNMGDLLGEVKETFVEINDQNLNFLKDVGDSIVNTIREEGDQTQAALAVIVEQLKANYSPKVAKMSTASKVIDLSAGAVEVTVSAVGGFLLGVDGAYVEGQGAIYTYNHGTSVGELHRNAPLNTQMLTRGSTSYVIDPITIKLEQQECLYQVSAASAYPIDIAVVSPDEEAEDMAPVEDEAPAPAPEAEEPAPEV